MINEEKKQQIAKRAALYVQRYPSQNMAANSLKGISAATLSNIINGKWERISDEMWLRLDSQLVSHEGWQIFSTCAYRDMTLYLSDAQGHSSVMWVTAPAGTGKSTAAASYALYGLTTRHISSATNSMGAGPTSGSWPIRCFASTAAT